MDLAIDSVDKAAKLSDWIEEGRVQNNPSGTSGAYIVADIVHLIDQLQAAKQIQIEIKWVPAYMGINGNELADIAAKELAMETKRTHVRREWCEPT